MIWLVKGVEKRRKIPTHPYTQETNRIVAHTMQPKVKKPPNSAIWRQNRKEKSSLKFES